MEKEPILSKWHKEKEISDEKIAEGFVSGEIGKKMGVRRKTFETSEGKKFYVYKEVGSLQEARDSMEIYQSMKRLGLPVVEFAKIIKTKSENGQDEFVIAMEDLTEDGKISVIGLNIGKDPNMSTKESLRREDIPAIIKENMVRTLAVIHNNNMYDYHPGISFAIRADLEDGRLKIIDFKIIDYANFCTIQMKELAEKRKEKMKETFEQASQSDLNVLIKGLTMDNQEREHLINLYWEIRGKK